MTTLLPTLTITAAISSALTTPVVSLPYTPRNLTIEAIFNYGSSGTSVDAYIQTSLDGGTTWIDIAQFHFTTSALKGVYNLSALTVQTTQIVPSDGTLSSNTAIDGILSTQYRAKYKSSGTYAGTTNLTLTINPGH
jgi:hypothetical protein